MNHFFFHLVICKQSQRCSDGLWPKLSTSIYNLLLINVCHFHHPFQWQLFNFGLYRDTHACILDLASRNFSVNRALMWFHFLPFAWIVKSMNDNFPYLLWLSVKKLSIFAWFHMKLLKLCKSGVNWNWRHKIEVIRDFDQTFLEKSI